MDFGGNKDKNEYEFLYARDIFDDDNDGYLFGIQSAEDFPLYIEWYRTLDEIKEIASNENMIVKNKEIFLGRFE